MITVSCGAAVRPGHHKTRALMSPAPQPAAAPPPRRAVHAMNIHISHQSAAPAACWHRCSSAPGGSGGNLPARPRTDDNDPLLTPAPPPSARCDGHAEIVAATTASVTQGPSSASSDRDIPADKRLYIAPTAPRAWDRNKNANSRTAAHRDMTTRQRREEIVSYASIKLGRSWLAGVTS